MVEPAELFRQMAERIERNAGNEFSGALLLVPPDGPPIEILLVSPKPDMEQFWATAESQVKAAQQEWLQRAQGTVGMYGAGVRMR